MANRHRSPSIRWWKFGIYFVSAGLLFFMAFVLFELSLPPQQPRGSDATPEVLLLTDERKASVTLKIGYYKFYRHTQEGLGFGPLSGSLPTGDREIKMTFYGGQPMSILSYAILLSNNSTEINPVGYQLEDPSRQLRVSVPGSTSSENCANAQTMAVTQVLSGRVRLNTQGVGNVDTVGELQNRHAFLSSGQDQIVGLVDVGSPIPPSSTVGSSGSCNFPDWPNLRGTLWYAPNEMGGEVIVGKVGGDYSVDTSNPPLADLSSLDWPINASTAISYTLTNERTAQKKQWDSFIAGVVAAAAAALLIEAVKAGIETFDRSDDSGQGRPVTPGHSTTTTNSRQVYRFVMLGILIAALRRVLAKPKNPVTHSTEDRHR